MELTAVLEALQAIDGPVVVHSDSTYVVNCFNDRWYEGWLAKNWRNSQRKPVANRDLWEPLVEIFQQRGDDLRFVWVKGHSGDPMNDLVDEMAVAEIESVRPAPGSSTDAGDSASGPVVPWPIERAVAVVGPTDIDADQVEALEEATEGLDPGYDIVISGLRRGAELTGAEAALRHGVPVGVVLPFADPASRWPVTDKARFDSCVEGAEWVVTLDGDQAKPGLAVKKRNDWLRSSVVGAMVVGDPALVGELEEMGLGVIEIEAEPSA